MPNLRGGPLCISNVEGGLFRAREEALCVEHERRPSISSLRRGPVIRAREQALSAGPRPAGCPMCRV